MFLRAVSVCINFSQYLEKVVNNRHFFDRWCIVTHAADHKTLSVCQKYELDVHLTGVLFCPGRLFPKGAMINEALAALPVGDVWTLLLDADMLLPANTRQVLEAVCTNSRLYYTAAERDSEEGKIPNLGGGVEGFFQLFHSTVASSYPAESLDSAGDDMRFVQKYWPDFRNRVMLTNLMPTHLGHTGTNRLGMIPTGA